MRSNGLATALTVLIVLCVTACSTSRKATEVSSSKLQVSSAESVNRVDSVVVELMDTLREITTITIQTNEVGDTVKVTQITDRTRARDRDRSRLKAERLEVKTDTVYIQKDSVSVEDKKIGLSASTDGSPKKPGFLTYVKWIFALICAITVLIITIKVCLRRI